MTILITNDDGLTDGLRILTEVGIKLDKNSYAIIPDQQKSAVAKGITMHKILRLNMAEEEKLPIYELNGTPADCVCFGIHSGEFKKPSLILSGVNTSDNLSFHSIYSSGTIGACIEAVFYDIPAIAFSLERHSNGKKRKITYGAEVNKDALKEKIIGIVKKLKGKIPPYTVINVNFPKDFENAEIVFPKPALLKYDHILEKRRDPHDNPYYWNYGEIKECERASDVYEFCINRCITITPISILKIVDAGEINRIKKLF